MTIREQLEKFRNAALYSKLKDGAQLKDENSSNLSKWDVKK